MLNNKEKKTPLLIEDLGMKFPTETSKKKIRYGIFLCACGTKFRAITSAIKKGNTSSCGCLRGVNHRKSTHKLYVVWSNMIRRTTDKKNEYYFGRGITVCERWKDINNFIDDMYPSYQEGLSIDRINNNGNYELSNCRWANKIIQARNTRILNKNNTSGYRGVYVYNKSAKWKSAIRILGKLHRIGIFSTALEAAQAYDNYVIKNKLEHTRNFS